MSRNAVIDPDPWYVTLGLSFALAGAAAAVSRKLADEVSNGVTDSLTAQEANFRQRVAILAPLWAALYGPKYR